MSTRYEYLQAELDCSRLQSDMKDWNWEQLAEAGLAVPVGPRQVAKSRRSRWKAVGAWALVVFTVALTVAVAFLKR